MAVGSLNVNYPLPHVSNGLKHFPWVFVMVPLRHRVIKSVSVSESCVTSMTLRRQRIGKHTCFI